MKVQIIAAGVLVVLMLANVFADDLYEYDPNRTEQHTILMSSSPYVTKTPSGNSALALGGTPAEIEDFVIGTTPGNVSDPYVPAHNIYAYKITDPCTSGPKKKAMIATGNHNTETGGGWAFQGMVVFLVSADPEADWLRKHVEFYIYPLVNPDGRYTATGRGNPEMTAEGFGTDHNRTWHTQGQGLSTIDALTVAMRADTCNDANFAFDFHGDTTDYFFIMPSQIDCPYVKAFTEREPSVPPKLRSGDYRMLRLWPLRPEGLNAESSFTPENNRNGTVQDKLDLGKNYGLAIYDVLDPNSDYLKLKRESENWLVSNFGEWRGELVGWWNFDDSDANDSSGNDHHGTIMGSVTIVEDANIIGAGNKVAKFPGDTSSFINCGGGGVGGTWADFARDAMTIAAWFRTDGAFYTSDQYVCAKEDMWRISRYWSSENISFFNAGLGSGSSNLRGTIKADDGQWHHVVGVYDGTNRYLYFDGELDVFDSRTGNLAETTWDVYIGGNGKNPGSTWRGWIDDVRLYNYALTPNDVNLLYQGSEPCEPQPLIICTEKPDGDWNDDCKVNFLDFQILAADWLKGIVYDEGVSANEFYSSTYWPPYEAIDATWTHMLGGGDNRVLVVAIAAEDDSDIDLAISSVKYNNVEMNVVPGSSVTVGTGTKVKTVLYYLLEADLPEPGYHTVAVLYSANDVAQRLGGSISRANVAQQAPEAVVTNSNTGQDTISTDITTVTADAWVVDVVAGDDEGSFSTTTGGMTEQWDVSGIDAGSTAAGATKSPASAGLTTMSWGYSSGANMLAHSIAAFEMLD